MNAFMLLGDVRFFRMSRSFRVKFPDFSVALAVDILRFLLLRYTVERCNSNQQVVKLKSNRNVFKIHGNGVMVSLPVGNTFRVVR